MLIEVSTIQSVTVVILRETELSKLNCARVRKSMAEVVDFKNPTILDLSLINYFDASGLSLILHWLAEGRRMGGKVLMFSHSPEFRSLTELVRISALTVVCTSLGEALDHFSQTSSSSYSDGQPATRVRRAIATAAGSPG